MRPLFRQASNTFRMLAFGVFVLSALTMVALWIGAFFDWLAWPGVLLGVLSAPLAVALPFVRWAVDGAFPTVPFAIWAVGLAGFVLSLGWGLLETRDPNRSREAGPC